MGEQLATVWERMLTNYSRASPGRAGEDTCPYVCHCLNALLWRHEKNPAWPCWRLLILVAAVVVFRGAGRWLDREDPLAHADVIFVLGGGMPERAQEAAKVYAQGYAPEVWFSRPDSPSDKLAKLGIRFVGEEEYSRQVLVHEGVPESAIHILAGPVVNTEEELQEAGRELRRNGKTPSFWLPRRNTPGESGRCGKNLWQ